MRRWILTTLLALSCHGAAQATDKDLRAVAAMRLHNRVLLVFAPSLGDARLAEQRREMDRGALENMTRDLLLVQVGGDTVIGAHDKAASLRRRFNVPPAAYRTLLIGKDGHVALTVDGPVAEKRLEAAIDAMPMRQEELRRARAGHAVRSN